ncbi:MAG: HNH endonuclease, partial [Acidimicrobiia bacterium]|nr:HNH endonuclease [Acidimicrobiia bacterium]
MEVEALLSRLAAAVPEELDRDGCNARLRDLSRLRSWLAADEIRTVRRLKALAAQGRAEPVEAALSNNSGRSASEARDTSDRETIADELPRFEDALADGAVTAGHLDALAMATKLLAAHVELVAEFKSREDELLGFALHESVDRFRQRCRRLARSLIAASDAGADDELERQRARSTVATRIDSQTGMWHLHAELDPLRGAIVDRHLHTMLAKLKAQDQQTGTKPLPYMQLKVDALVTAMFTT